MYQTLPPTPCLLAPIAASEDLHRVYFHGVDLPLYYPPVTSRYVPVPIFDRDHLELPLMIVAVCHPSDLHMTLIRSMIIRRDRALLRHRSWWWVAERLLDQGWVAVNSYDHDVRLRHYTLSYLDLSGTYRYIKIVELAPDVTVCYKFTSTGWVYVSQCLATQTAYQTLRVKLLSWITSFTSPTLLS